MFFCVLHFEVVLPTYLYVYIPMYHAPCTPLFLRFPVTCDTCDFFAIVVLLCFVRVLYYVLCLHIHDRIFRFLPAATSTYNNLMCVDYFLECLQYIVFVPGTCLFTWYFVFIWFCDSGEGPRHFTTVVVD